MRTRGDLATTAARTSTQRRCPCRFRASGSKTFWLVMGSSRVRSRALRPGCIPSGSSSGPWSMVAPRLVAWTSTSGWSALARSRPASRALGWALSGAPPLAARAARPPASAGELSLVPSALGSAGSLGRCWAGCRARCPALARAPNGSARCQVVRPDERANSSPTPSGPIMRSSSRFPTSLSCRGRVRCECSSSGCTATTQSRLGRPTAWYRISKTAGVDQAEDGSYAIAVDGGVVFEEVTRPPPPQRRPRKSAAKNSPSLEAGTTFGQFLAQPLIGCLRDGRLVTTVLDRSFEPPARVLRSGHASVSIHEGFLEGVPAGDYEVAVSEPGSPFGLMCTTRVRAQLTFPEPLC